MQLDGSPHIIDKAAEAKVFNFKGDAGARWDTGAAWRDTVALTFDSKQGGAIKNSEREYASYTLLGPGGDKSGTIFYWMTMIDLPAKELVSTIYGHAQEGVLGPIAFIHITIDAVSLLNIPASNEPTRNTRVRFSRFQLVLGIY